MFAQTGAQLDLAALLLTCNARQPGQPAAGDVCTRDLVIHGFACPEAETIYICCEQFTAVPHHAYSASAVCMQTLGWPEADADHPECLSGQGGS